jgi:hypothetical protein
MRKVMLGVLAMSVLITGQSFAATIDFRKDIWNPNGSDAKTVGQVTAQAGPVDHFLTWSNVDGFGVDSKGDREQDEINNEERLAIEFANPFLVTGLLITNLFDHETIPGSLPFDEQGQFRINGTGNWFTFTASHASNNPNGELTLDFGLGLANVSLIEFRAVTGQPGDPLGRRNDFSVATVTATASPVPEPTSMLLLGSGLVGLAARFRRKQDA